MLFLLMLDYGYFILKRLNNSSSRKSGRTILTHKKYEDQYCHINKISMHCSIKLKFTTYILEAMSFIRTKTRPLILIQLLRYKRNKQKLYVGRTIVAATVYIYLIVNCYRGYYLSLKYLQIQTFLVKYYEKKG